MVPGRHVAVPCAARYHGRIQTRAAGRGHHRVAIKVANGRDGAHYVVTGLFLPSDYARVVPGHLCHEQHLGRPHHAGIARHQRPDATLVVEELDCGLLLVGQVRGRGQHFVNLSPVRVRVLVVAACRRRHADGTGIEARVGCRVGKLRRDEGLGDVRARRDLQHQRLPARRV